MHTHKYTCMYAHTYTHTTVREKEVIHFEESRGYMEGREEWKWGK